VDECKTLGGGEEPDGAYHSRVSDAGSVSTLPAVTREDVAGPYPCPISATLHSATCVLFQLEFKQFIFQPNMSRIIPCTTGDSSSSVHVGLRKGRLGRAGSWMRRVRAATLVHYD
jgi:hypothetical protein